MKNSVCGPNSEHALSKAALNSFRADKISIPRIKPKISSKAPSSIGGGKSQQNLQTSSKSALMQQSQVAPCHQSNLNASISSISSSSFESTSPNASISPISLPSISTFQTTSGHHHHHHVQPNSSSTPNNLIISNQSQNLAHNAASSALNGISMPIAAAAAAAACMNMKPPGHQSWLSFSQQNKLTPPFHHAAMPLHLATNTAHGTGAMSDKPPPPPLTLNEAFLLNHHQPMTNSN